MERSVCELWGIKCVVKHGAVNMGIVECKVCGKARSDQHGNCGVLSVW